MNTTVFFIIYFFGVIVSFTMMFFYEAYLSQKEKKVKMGFGDILVSIMSWVGVICGLGALCIFLIERLFSNIPGINNPFYKEEINKENNV